jgi:hypothetical protein
MPLEGSARKMHMNVSIPNTTKGCFRIHYAKTLDCNFLNICKHNICKKFVFKITFNT